MTVPAVVGYGTDTSREHVSGAAWLAEHLPDAELHVVADTGHFAHRTHPAEFARLRRRRGGPGRRSRPPSRVLGGPVSPAPDSLPAPDDWVASWIEPIEPPDTPDAQRPAYHLAGDLTDRRTSRLGAPARHRPRRSTKRSSTAPASATTS